MDIEIKGIESLRSKLKQIPNVIQQASVQAMFEATETVRSAAENNAPVGASD